MPAGTGAVWTVPVPGLHRREADGTGGGQEVPPQSPCRGFTMATGSFQDLPGAGGHVQQRDSPVPCAPSPAAPASPSQPYILLHMPIWSRPVLWNVKKYVFLGWDPHAKRPHRQQSPEGASGETMRCWGW